jgi:hypothetical protein
MKDYLDGLLRQSKIVSNAILLNSIQFGILFYDFKTRIHLLEEANDDRFYGHSQIVTTFFEQFTTTSTIRMIMLKLLFLFCPSLSHLIDAETGRYENNH